MLDAFSYFVGAILFLLFLYMAVRLTTAAYYKSRNDAQRQQEK